MEFSNDMLFDRAMAEAFYGSAPERAGRFYDDDRGLVVRSDIDGNPFHQDLIQFDPDAFAFTGSGTPRPLPLVGHHNQTIESGDWLHFCLRLGGRGLESISNFADIDQPSRSCIVTRYPAGARIERISSPVDGWRTACLWLRPAAVLRFLETTVSRVPEHLSLLVDPGHIDTPTHFSLPLDGRMVLAVNQVLDCPFTGGTRRAFVRSRYLEILALIYQAAVEMPAETAGLSASLTPRTAEAVARAATLVASRLDCMGSLDEIAREVGISRTRLTHGFRALMGTSVEVYWQQCRMNHARDRLCEERVAISELAQQLGYAELASFSRAFSRAFGISPSRMRSKG
ncbi:helix-turn-helix domain-containing protein [Neotabrizicola sp. sgz301269]|uniref:helix-turn-helix domain-containing protein n=1 Tax=Neotabrizicola sp. sgz301269 TaxID=3276282 RepID=UPI00376FADB9